MGQPAAIELVVDVRMRVEVEDVEVVMDPVKDLDDRVADRVVSPEADERHVIGEK